MLNQIFNFFKKNSFALFFLFIATSCADETADANEYDVSKELKEAREKLFKYLFRPQNQSLSRFLEANFLPYQEYFQNNIKDKSSKNANEMLNSIKIYEKALFMEAGDTSLNSRNTQIPFFIPSLEKYIGSNYKLSDKGIKLSKRSIETKEIFNGSIGILSKFFPGLAEASSFEEYFKLNKN